MRRVSPGVQAVGASVAGPESLDVAVERVRVCNARVRAPGTGGLRGGQCAPLPRVWPRRVRRVFESAPRGAFARPRHGRPRVQSVRAPQRPALTSSRPFLSPLSFSRPTSLLCSSPALLYLYRSKLILLGLSRPPSPSFASLCAVL